MEIPPGTYILSITGTNENAGATGDLDITANMTIQGVDAATTVINGSQIDRVFDIFANLVTISGIKVTNGKPETNADGGGIRVGAASNVILLDSIISNNIARWGGGIDNNWYNTSTGQLFISNSMVSGNSAETSGGINNFGILEIVSTSISGNSAQWAAGIYNGAGGDVTITKSTISANMASNDGAGITNDGGGTLAVTNSTISGNSAINLGGGIANFGVLELVNNTLIGNSAANGGAIYGEVNSVNLFGNIFSSNLGGNCYVPSGVNASTGYNISSDNTCLPYLTFTGDQNNTDPLLGILQDNGGSTLTHALQPGSPAVDAIPTANCTVINDQRDVVRPQGSACDIGALELIPDPVQTGLTLTVNVTNDNNASCTTLDCSLREAINAANANSDTNTIAFNIPGGGVQTIQPTSPLPTVINPVIMDGTTQPGYAVGAPVIELDGTNAGFSADGLVLVGGGSTVRGLVINRFNSNGIVITTTGGNTIEGNFIGTDATGTVALGNTLNGVQIASAPNNIIGGTAAGARNLIAGNENGIVILDATATGNLVQGNYIGTDVTGTLALGNTNFGVVATFDAGGNTIGGTAAGAGNLISGNNPSSDSLTGAGVGIAGNANVVQGNKIGTDVTGTLPLGNGFAGIWIENATNSIIGGISGSPNIIAFNNGDGVYFRFTNGTPIGNQITTNSIFSNTNLGIDLGNTEGVTTNDPNDNDTGANNLQNFPVLTSALASLDMINLQGALNSQPNQTYRLEFFANNSCDPSGYGEGQTYLGFTDVTTNGDGDVTFSSNLSVVTSNGQFITATATDPDNNTSEFSACVPVIVIPPPSAPTAAPSQNYFTTSSVALSWKGVSWALGYEIEVDNNNNFSSPEYVQSLIGGIGTVGYCRTAL